jgi:putative methyltransferase (TIGR04325 family)
VDAALKNVIARFLPPIVLDAWRARRLGATSSAGGTNLPEWEAVSNNESVWTADAGWSHDSIVEAQKSKWSDFVAGVQDVKPFGVSHEASPGIAPDIGAHNMVMSFGYVVGRALAGGNHLSVLDWGGGIGHYAVYAKALYPDVAFDYVIKDLPEFCTVGREFLPDVSFVADDQAAFARTYDLVFASSSLHYTRNFYGQLGEVCASAGRYLMITRTPVVTANDDFVVVQRPHRYGYLTQYACWFLNRGKLIDFIASHGLKLKREFLLDERPYVPNAPEQCVYGGFLFERE